MGPCIPNRIAIWKCWFLWREENWRTWRKNPGARALQVTSDHYFAALFIELERLIDMQELPKNGDGLTKPGRFVYSISFVLKLISIEAILIIFYHVVPLLSISTPRILRGRVSSLEKLLRESMKPNWKFQGGCEGSNKHPWRRYGYCLDPHSIDYYHRHFHFHHNCYRHPHDDDNN